MNCSLATVSAFRRCRFLSWFWCCACGAVSGFPSSGLRRLLPPRLVVLPGRSRLVPSAASCEQGFVFCISEVFRSVRRSAPPALTASPPREGPLALGSPLIFSWFRLWLPGHQGQVCSWVLYTTPPCRVVESLRAPGRKLDLSHSTMVLHGGT